MKMSSVERFLWDATKRTVAEVAQEVPGLVVRALNAHDPKLEAQHNAQLMELQAKVYLGDRDHQLKMMEHASKEKVQAWLCAQYEGEGDVQVRLALLKTLESLF